MIKSDKLHTREQKIKWLKDVKSGKVNKDSFLHPISVILFIDEGLVYAFHKAGVNKTLEVPITEEEFEATYGLTATHKVIIEDYSGNPGVTDNENKKGSNEI